jgi:hypothetical protein
MRRSALALLIATMLAACSESQPPAETAQKAPPAAPADAAKAPAAAPAPGNAMAAKEVPEGDCGDQGKVSEDQRVANTARWSTASEQNSFSFDVFRSETEKGEFTKITKMPMMGAGTTDETHKYEYRDDTIDPCKDYWYYVESTSTKGEKEKFTPVFHAPAKRRARGSAPPAPGQPQSGQ